MRGYNPAPQTQAVPQAGGVSFGGGVPPAVGVLPRGFSPGGLQMPQGIGMLPLGLGGAMGMQGERPVFAGFDQSPARMEAPQAQPVQMPSRQEPTNPNANMQSLVASAQGAMKANQPTGGIDFDAIAKFFQSGSPQARNILGPGGFNDFAGSVSSIFRPIQTAMSGGAQSILNLLRSRSGRAG